jgi:hypothetical protein
LLQNSVFASFKQNKPIGASPLGQFLFFGGEGGVWAKKVVTLRGLRISEKKEILRKLTVHTFVLIYLSTLSTKDFAKINKITMVTPFAGSYCMTMIFLPPPPL